MAWTMQVGTVQVHIYGDAGVAFHGPAEYDRGKPIPGAVEARELVDAANAAGLLRAALARLVAMHDDRYDGEPMSVSEAEAWETARGLL